MSQSAPLFLHSATPPCTAIASFSSPELSAHLLTCISSFISHSPYIVYQFCSFVLCELLPVSTCYLLACLSTCSCRFACKPSYLQLIIQLLHSPCSHLRLGPSSAACTLTRVMLYEQYSNPITRQDS